MPNNANTDWLIWHRSPTERAENRDAVHVWGCDLEDAASDPFCDETTLNDKERERAQRVQFPRGRRLSLRRRAIKRFLLGQYLGVAPASLVFAEGDLDKPRLAPPFAERASYSTAESENLFVLAIGAAGEVGVDVEVIRSGWDWEGVAEMYLDGRRLAQLKALPAEQRQENFLRFWSLREAFARATGPKVADESDEGIAQELVWELLMNPAQATAAPAVAGWRWRWDHQRMGHADVVVATAVRL